MIVNVLTENDSTPIVRVEVHVKGVDIPIAVIVDNDGTASSSICFTSAIWLDSCKPGWVCGDIVQRGEVDVGSVEGIQLIQVVQSQGIWDSIDSDKIVLWLCMDELGAKVAGLVSVIRI